MSVTVKTFLEEGSNLPPNIRFLEFEGRRIFGNSNGGTDSWYEAMLIYVKDEKVIESYPLRFELDDNIFTVKEKIIVGVKYLQEKVEGIKG